MIDERDLICKMAAEHCMSIAWLTEAEKEGKKDPEHH